MLPVYFFALLLGGGLLLLSVLGGDGGDGELEMDLGELDMEGFGDVGEMDGGDATSAAKIFSLRGAIYAAFGFGATGSTLTWLGAGTVPTAVTSVLGGLLAGALVSLVFGYLHRTESGQPAGDSALEGLAGRMVLPMGAGSPGAVVVERGGRRLRLRALPFAETAEDPEAWEDVVVVEVQDGVARVAPIEDERLLDA